MPVTKRDKYLGRCIENPSESSVVLVYVPERAQSRLRHLHCHPARVEGP